MALSPMPAAISDPGSGMPLVDAVRWLQALLLGTPATIVAVLAVASVGALALAGRIPLRRAALVVLGCFVLFGAPTIAGAFVDLARADSEPTAEPVLPPEIPPPEPSPTSQLTPQPYDPYAGASVPVRR